MMARRIMSLFFLVLFPLLEAACYAHLHWKRKDILVRKRNMTAIYVASLAGWLAYFGLIVSTTGGVPCGLFYMSSLLVSPMSIGPQIMRALSLRGTIRHSQLVTEEEMSSRAQRNQGKLLAIGINDLSGCEKGDESSTSPHLMSKLMEANLVMEKTRRAVRATKWVLVISSALLLSLALALASGSGQLLAMDFERCQPEPTSVQYAGLAFSVVNTALALVVTILVRNIDDEIGLRREIQRNAVLLGVTCVVIIAVRFMDHYDWQPLLQTMQQMILYFSMAIVPSIPEASPDRVASWAKKRINPDTKSAVPGYAQSLPKEHRSSTRTSIQAVLGRRNSLTTIKNDQRSREVTISWDAGLCILLSSEEGINLFSRHCAREFSSENVHFWCAVNDYKAKFDEEKCVPPSTVVDDEKRDPIGQMATENNIDMRTVAKEVYSQFIDHRSKTQINLSWKQRRDIKNAFESGLVDREMFDAAQREIFLVMSRDSYPRFLASKKNRRHST